MKEYISDFFSWDGASYELHPALRDFLVKRSVERRNHAKRVRAVGHALLTEEAWHEAFTLVRDYESDELLLELIDKATDPLLADSSMSTLEQWLNYAAERRLRNEVLDFAEAEVAFRSASYTKAGGPRRAGGRWIWPKPSPHVPSICACRP